MHFPKLGLSLRNRCGQVTLDSVIGLVVTLLVVGFLLGLGLIMNVKFKDQSSSAAANGSIDKISDAFSDIAGWMPLIALAVIAVIIIGLMMIFRGAGRR